jgi:hypothetical protein
LAISEQRTANSEQRTANSEQRTANSEQRTANSEQRTANSEQRTANSDPPLRIAARRGGVWMWFVKAPAPALERWLLCERRCLISEEECVVAQSGIDLFSPIAVGALRVPIAS